MRRMPFMLLAAATVAAVALTVILDRGGHRDGPEGQKLVPGLVKKANEVTGLVHRNADGVVAALSRGETEWQVAELGGYPADWQRVRATLSALADAAILEYKTSNPDYFDRLGVEGPDVSGSASAELQVTAGEQQWTIIAGKVPDLQFGQYARLGDAQQAVLIDQELDLPDETIDWVDRQVLDVGAGLVADVEIRHADGEIVKLSKVSADDSNFQLKTMAEGRELKSVYTLNSAAGMFAMLELDGVRRDDIPESTVQAESVVTSFSGVRITAEVIELSDMQAAAGDESGATPWVRIRAELVDPDTATEPAQEMLDNIQGRTEGWLYRFSSTRTDNLLRRNEFFLKSLDDQ